MQYAQVPDQVVFAMRTVVCSKITFADLTVVRTVPQYEDIMSQTKTDELRPTRLGRIGHFQIIGEIACSCQYECSQIDCSF